MLCRLGVMETERMYEVLNRQMNFKTTSLATLKKHTDGLAGEVTRSSQGKRILQHQYDGLHSSYVGYWD